MYRKILVALENGKGDTHLIDHVRELARRLDSELLLVHVADGFAARNYDQLKLAKSDEIEADEKYLHDRTEALAGQGVRATSRLEMGDPATQIVKVAGECGCDLIAMLAHGHRLVGDLFLGSTIEPVRHRTRVPVLLVREPE